MAVVIWRSRTFERTFRRIWSPAFTALHRTSASKCFTKCRRPAALPNLFCFRTGGHCGTDRGFALYTGNSNRNPPAWNRHPGGYAACRAGNFFLNWGGRYQATQNACGIFFCFRSNSGTVKKIPAKSKKDYLPRYNFCKSARNSGATELPSQLRLDRYFYLRTLRIQDDGRAADQFSPAKINIDVIGLSFLRTWFFIVCIPTSGWT